MQQDSLFHPMMKVIDDVVWQTEGSIVLARQDDVVLGKKTAERYLFRTANGQFFEQIHHAGLGKANKLSSDDLKPLDAKDALKKYGAFKIKYLSPADAFPEAQQA